MIQRKQQFADRENSFSRRFHKSIEEFMGGNYRGISYRGNDVWQPAMNVYSDEIAHYVIMDISGMKLSEMNVEAKQQELVICGCRPMPQPPCAKGSARIEHMEIDSGRFCRTLKIPEDGDVEGITASYKKGQLIVVIPKI